MIGLHSIFLFVQHIPEYFYYQYPLWRATQDVGWTLLIGSGIYLGIQHIIQWIKSMKSRTYPQTDSIEKNLTESEWLVAMDKHLASSNTHLQIAMRAISNYMNESTASNFDELNARITDLHAWIKNGRSLAVKHPIRFQYLASKYILAMNEMEYFFNFSPQAIDEKNNFEMNECIHHLKQSSVYFNEVREGIQKVSSV